MARTKTLPYDTANYLGTVEDIAAYLDAALEDGDAELVAAALGDIARQRHDAARATGLGRESLYKALSANGNPEFATVLKMVRAMGMTLTASLLPEGPRKRRRPKVTGVAAASARR